MNVWSATSLILLFIFVIAATVMDFRSLRISNRLILAGLIISLVLRILAGGASEFIPYLGNVIFPVIVLYLFYLIGALGAGDIKLFSMIGGFVNFRELGCCMVSAFLVGAVFSLVKLLAAGRIKAQLFSGGVYLLSLLWGNRQRYEWDKEEHTNLIHFSLPILIGLCISTYLSYYPM